MPGWIPRNNKYPRLGQRIAIRDAQKATGLPERPHPMGEVWDAAHLATTTADAKAWDDAYNAALKKRGISAPHSNVAANDGGFTIDQALQVLQDAKKVMGGDRCLILSLTNSGIEDVDVQGMSIQIDGEDSAYVEVRARHEGVNKLVQQAMEGGLK